MAPLLLSPSAGPRTATTRRTRPALTLPAAALPALDDDVTTPPLDFVLPPTLEAHEPPEHDGRHRDDVRLLVASATSPRASQQHPQPGGLAPTRRPARREHLGHAARRPDRPASTRHRPSVRQPCSSISPHRSPVASGWPSCVVRLPVATSRCATRSGRTTSWSSTSGGSCISSLRGDRLRPTVEPGSGSSSPISIDRSRATWSPTVARSSTGPPHVRSGSTPTRASSPARRAAPRCRARHVRSPRRSSPTSSPTACSLRRCSCTPVCHRSRRARSLRSSAIDVPAGDGRAGRSRARPRRPRRRRRHHRRTGPRDDRR